MSVSEHLQFALAAQSVPKRDRPVRIDQMLKSVGLDGRERQLPGTDFAVLEQGRLSPPAYYTELLKAPVTPFTRKLALLLAAN